MKVFQRDIRDVSDLLETAEFAEGCSSQGLTDRLFQLLKRNLCGENLSIKSPWIHVKSIPNQWWYPNPEKRIGTSWVFDLTCSGKLPIIQGLIIVTPKTIFFRWVEFAWQCRKPCYDGLVWNRTRYCWFYSKLCLSMSEYEESIDFTFKSVSNHIAMV